MSTEETDFGAVHDEVETVTVYRGGELTHLGHAHHAERIEDASAVVKIEQLTVTAALEALPLDSIWRVKGFIKLADESWVSVNWAFGRCDIKCYNGGGVDGEVRITLMGSRGSVQGPAKKFATALGSFLCGHSTRHQ